MDTWLVAASNKRPVPDPVVGPTAAVGDRVVLCRLGNSSAVVALGAIVEVSDLDEQSQSLLWLMSGRRPSDQQERPSHKAVVFYDNLFLSNPVAFPLLDEVGLGQIAQVAKKADPTRFGSLTASTHLALDDALWALLVETVDAEGEPRADIGTWPIQPGMKLPRDHVHAAFGGGRGAAECSNARTPNDMLFVQLTPDDPELVPRWDGEVLLAAGQAQRGSVDATGGRTVVDSHVLRGRPLRVFEADGEYCRYVGEFAVDQASPIERWVDGGRRPVKNRGRSDETAQFRVPLLRLRQLDGIEAFHGDLSPFHAATPLSLALRTSVIHGRDYEDGVEGTALRLIQLLRDGTETTGAIEQVDALQALNALVQHARYQADIDALRAAVADPDSREADLQKLVERMPWLFGGQFLSETGRRGLTTKDQLDISLLRPDGTLHGVELKKANIKGLIEPEHSHFRLGLEATKAVSQAMNYLCALDEDRHRILAEHAIDTRRASITVVIGSLAFVKNGISARQVAETIRIHNSHVPRIQVTTYDQLIDDAQRAFGLSGPPPDTAGGRPQEDV